MLRNLLRLLFLVKEIKSKKGELHFQRWRLVETFLFSVYIHYIAKSDEDKHPHDHPWNFASLILNGGYTEKVTDPKTGEVKSFERPPGSFFSHSRFDFHQLTLHKPTWTLVFCGLRDPGGWGFHTEEGWKHHSIYREEKRKGKWL